MRLIVGWDLAVSRWVGGRLGIDDFGPCRTLGIADSSGLIAGVVFNNYRKPENIEATIASVNQKWCTRGTLRAIFSIPFEQYNCLRVTAVVESMNDPARKFLCKLGFRQEGLMRCGFRGGGDAVIYGLLRSECRWLEEQHVKRRHKRPTLD